MNYRHGMGIVRLLIILGAAVWFAPRVGAQGSDAFATATAITGASGQDSGNNTLATKEAGEPDHTGNAGGHSLWWTWTAPASAFVEFDTAGSDFDTLLAVYTGDGVSSLTLVAGNDDFSDVSTSKVFFAATSGSVYRIAVDGFKSGPGSIGKTGNIQLHWSTFPSTTNDNFAQAKTITGSTGQEQGGNYTASKEPGEPDHAGETGGRSVWYSWTAPSSSRFEFSTFGSNVDTLLAIYVGSSVNALSVIAQNDNINQLGLSRVDFVTTQGLTYMIAIDVVDGDRGDLQLNWVSVAPITNDNFSQATAIVGESGTAAGTNFAATAEAGEPGHAEGTEAAASVWWSWTAPASGHFEFDTLHSDFDTVLAVYRGTNVGALNVLASNDEANDDFDNLDESSRAEFIAEAGVTYKIAVDGYYTPLSGDSVKTGNIRLHWSPVAPGNDDIKDAFVLLDAGGDATETNAFATKEPGEPDHVDGGGTHSIWLSSTLGS